MVSYNHKLNLLRACLELTRKWEKGKENKNFSLLVVWFLCPGREGKRVRNSKRKSIERERK